MLPEVYLLYICMPKIQWEDHCSKKNVQVDKYIEDITRRCEDMNFIFEWLKQYFTNERSE